ncbi:VWA domain-containing protein [Coraliomargarita sp. W4R53]
MSDFVFQWPAALALLLFTLPLIALLRYARKQRLAVIRSMGGGRSTHRRLRDVLRVLAFACLVLALARPGYAPRMESTSRTGRDVVFALDVSRSMLAQDVPPSRLEVAKQGIRDALDQFTNERVGLIVYGGSASILCPLTNDYEFARYMLEQAHPRSVDFGGTTLQSAIEKAVDQVFIAGREEVQDLIILTDGEDNGSRFEKALELLNEASVDTLLIGIGDPHNGSPIPVKNEDGGTTFLEQNGSTVYTQLDGEALRALAADSTRIQYLPVGTTPFNLGKIYQDYAQELPVDANDSENGIRIYQEAAPYLLIVALILLLLSECWGASGLQVGQAALLLCTLYAATPAEMAAAAPAVESAFSAAIDTFKAGDFEAANTQFSEVYDYATSHDAAPRTLAPIQFNRGLSLIQLAQANAEANPQTALNYAQSAELAFLSAKRYQSELTRAGIRLEATSQLIGQLKAHIEAQEQADADLQAQMEKLIELLQALLDQQTQLRQSLEATDPERFNNRRKKPAPVEPAPEIVANLSQSMVAQQNLRIEESAQIRSLMEAIDRQLTPPDIDLPDFETVLTEPLRLFTKVQAEQGQSVNLLAAWIHWPDARDNLQVIEQTIKEILELLSSDSDQNSEESEEYEDMEEDYDYSEDSEESMSSSDAMQGDFAAAAEMQALPEPNYSADDILMEEQGSLQFRQQKRAAANAAKVENDY